MTIIYSLVIPCYNEAATLHALTMRLIACCAGRDDTEIILVDNGSTDASPALLAEAVAAHPFLRTVRVETNRGYGWGILQGLAASRGAFLGWTHADMQTDPVDALTGFTLLTALNARQALVKGRRYGRPLSDICFTMGMSLFDSALFGLPLWDINAQPTLFTREFYETWRQPPRDFALDLYVYATAVRNKVAVARFPTRFGKRLHGTSHWNINWQAKWKFIKRTIDFSFELKRNWNNQ